MANLSSSRVLRPGELAERLGVSRVTLWRWEREGRLPAKRRIGPNVVGWLECEIDDWFARTDGDAPAAGAESSGDEAAVAERRSAGGGIGR
jgi:prophage regulatory protein